MKADHTKQPPAVAAAPTPAGVPGMATEPAVRDAHQGHEEPNALQKWLVSTWEKVKTGRVGNPKWFVLILAVGLVVAAWWFLRGSSKKADSALWRAFAGAVSTDGLKEFADLPANAKTEAAQIARVNMQRNRMIEGRMGLRADKLADRLKAAKALEEARDELVKLADEFAKDRTMKAMTLLAAADAEKALIGVPKEGVAVMGLDVKGNGRGQVERYAELLRKAADAVGPAPADAAKYPALVAARDKYIAEADKYTKEAGDVYTACGYIHAAFNEPDAVDKKPEGTSPLGGLGGFGGDDSLRPFNPLDKSPDGPAKPAEKKADDKPLKPVEPKGNEKKPDEKKPDDKPLTPIEPKGDEKK